MPQLEILEHPDPRLRLKSAPVAAFDDDLGRLVDDLIETLHAKNGMGLSAPQVNDQRQIMVMDHSEDQSAPEVFINPEILKKSAWGVVQESCLSVPGVVGNVWRATRVEVRAKDRTGKVFEQDLQGMPAVCLLHEVDHLDGKLFIDRFSIIGKLRLRARARAQARGNATAT